MPQGAGIMLNQPTIRSEVKEAIILLVFAGLMIDTLIGTTILLVFTGAILVWLKIRPAKILRNIITLGIFASYWFTYGKVIDPEVGLNFLTSIVVLKLLEKESERDRYMIFYGLILLISAGSLFEKNISYVLFFGLSFFILISDFYKGLKLSTRWRDLIQSFIWVLPLTIFLFFLAPRMLNPFHMESGEPGKGEIGYTPEVNLSTIESLASNGDVVFQAVVPQQMNYQELYWRGNTLSFTDGWNWPVMPWDRVQREFDLELKPEEGGFRQQIRVFAKYEFFFGLDHPKYFITPKGVANLDQQRTLSMNRWQNVLKYEVISYAGGIQAEDLTRYQRLPRTLEKEDKTWIEERFKSKDLPRLVQEIQTYFRNEKFSYSLSPGRVENFMDFVNSKKIGFCSHYASAVGLILRQKKIPVRLVSGFMGGTYNRFAGFYLITQNDAHVWVEAHHQGKWVRIDPTDWIAPDRVKLGGEAYVAQVSEQNAARFSPLRILNLNAAWIGDLKQWFNQWDFRFYQWLEEMDYYGQEALLSKFNIKREWIFSFIPLLLAFFMGIYTWHLNLKRLNVPELEILWNEFRKRLKARGIELQLTSVSSDDSLLKNYQGEDKDQLLEVWSKLLKASFESGNWDLSELKKLIQRL
jgi:hypothetical protein